MDVDLKQIQELIDRPSESLSCELKCWIDPGQPEDLAKIVKAALALRNHGGGYLVIGFNDKTLQPDVSEESVDTIRSRYHLDRIQGLIAKYASEVFEVAVVFPKRANQVHPVIVVPSGVKTPVACKADLDAPSVSIAGAKHGRGPVKLLATDDVYVRSLSANNTPSTSRARWKDWDSVVRECFDNREADIGRFFRRHLAGIESVLIERLAAAVATECASRPSSRTEKRRRGPRVSGRPKVARVPPGAAREKLLKEWLLSGEKRYKQVLAERNIVLPRHGTWEAALIVRGKALKCSANEQFLSLLAASNPRYTGWPVWLVSTPFKEPEARPYVFDRAWEALIVDLDPGQWVGVDFVRFDPRGRFYHLRVLEDDLRSGEKSPTPGAEFDFALPVLRIAEAIAVGKAFAEAMGYRPEDTNLLFAFRWAGLKGRRLTAWASRGRRFMPAHRVAYQDEITTYVTVPLETPLSAVGEVVGRAVEPLFEAFDGFTLGGADLEELCTRLFERRIP